MSGPDAAQRHLLVVDDDDRIRDLLKQYLARAGFRVTTAADAAAARKLLEHARLRPAGPGRDDAGRGRAFPHPLAAQAGGRGRRRC